jgi:hypothetical protein
MTKRSEKIKWEFAGADFDLIPANPESIDRNHFRKLLTDVETASANWRRNIHFNRKAYKAFEKWIANPDRPLQEFAYALLSNWFLTDLKFIKESPRGQAALRFWNSLFCAVPEERITNPERNDKILQEKFCLWWNKQQKCQRGEK